MSLDTWLTAYYPEHAAEAAERGTEAALRHSIRKWEGLTPEALAEHGISREGCHLHANIEIPFTIGDRTCALCVLYSGPNAKGRWCVNCPIVLSRGVPCDYGLPSEEYKSPYHSFTSGGDPAPMLATLRAALVQIEAAK